MEHRDEKLKWLLKRSLLPQPPLNFTGEVMKDIEALSKDGVYVDNKLKSLINNHGLTSPPSDFTFKVLNKTRAAQYDHRRDSIISSRAWIMIGVAMILLALTAFTGRTPATGGTVYFISVGNFLREILSRYSDGAFYAMVITSAVVVLLLIDHWLSRKAVHRINSD